MCRLSFSENRPTCQNTSLSIRQNIGQQVKCQCVIFKIFLDENSFCQITVQRKCVSCMLIVLRLVNNCPVLSRRMSPIQLGKTAIFKSSSTKIPFLKFVSNAQKSSFSNNFQRKFFQKRYRLLHFQMPEKTVFRVLRENDFDSNLHQFASFTTLPSKSIRKPLLRFL